MEERRIYPSGPDDVGRRLDRVLRIAFPGLTLSSIFSSLRKGVIRVNGLRAEPGYRIMPDDLLAVPARMDAAADIALTDPNPANLPPKRHHRQEVLSSLVVLRSRDLLFLNKPRGMLMHGADSLESLILEAWKTRPESQASLAFRPGPLHRLDRNTSGLVTFPETAEGSRFFTALLRERQVGKLYLALLQGNLKKEQHWQDWLVRNENLRKTIVSDPAKYPDAGKKASTEVFPIISNENYTLVCIKIHTGITHQIRTQAALHGHPLAGDVKYGGKRDNDAYILHSWRMHFTIPPFPDIPQTVTAEPDESLVAGLSGIFGTGVTGFLSEAAERLS